MATKKLPEPTHKQGLTEFYWHWSKGAGGRALWKVSGKIIGDHRGPTTRNNKPIDFIMLTQIYGNAKALLHGSELSRRSPLPVI